MKSFITFIFETKKEKPRTFYRWSTPGATERIKTGDDHWDSHFFVSSHPEAGKYYGTHRTAYDASPDAKILYHGTKEYRSMAKGIKGNMLQHSSEVAKRAKAAGYHAVHFERQGDVGTAFFDKSKLVERKDKKAIRQGHEVKEVE